ncbi:MAG: transglutaminase domain-containing protein [Hyphomonadaceae bacterium]|nr:transglutaminase domain-containing protein [Hyphomonadaceae bacterium]
MKLSIRHVTRYAYEPAIERAALRLKLFPTRCAAQTPLSWSVRVNGAAVEPLLVNGFGDREAIWCAKSAVSEIEIVAEGEVETADTAGVVRGVADSARPGVFLRTTPLTAASEPIRALAQSCKAGTTLETLHALMAAVRDAMAYRTGSTDPTTTAAQALAQRSGVCQDHAHVFIAAARALGAPARYVAGYVSPDIDGAHETHAWAEAYAPELGWVGFDPANRQCPTEAYVRLAVGFDAVDAAPVRGSIAAGARETLSADVQIAQEMQ